MSAPPVPATPVTEPMLVDAHVHIYDCFDVEQLLDAAIRNFAGRARRRGLDGFHGVLLLTETATDHAFARLAGFASRRAMAPYSWQFVDTPEAETIIARREDGSELAIVAGRQIVTEEKLEILALGTVSTFVDGLPADDSLAAVAAAGGLAVLPWGVGKWWGSRGRLTDAILDRTDPSAVLLGDNSGRPWFLPLPSQFRTAAATGRRILPGSDPLPFPREAARAGSVGALVYTSWDEARPAAALKSALTDRSTRIEPFMKTERLLPFMLNQAGMQLRKRRR